MRGEFRCSATTCGGNGHPQCAQGGSSTPPNSSSPEFCRSDTRSYLIEKRDSAQTVNGARMLQRCLSAAQVRGHSMSHATPIVFVVDDDVSVRRSLELLIGSAGWKPETFASAQEFLSSQRVPAASCLVLDVSLPDLNGLELQKRIAGDRSDMPIIFISGYGNVPMTVQAMKAGAVEFLTKPFSDDVLLTAIRNAIERSQTALGHEAEMRALP